VFYLCLVNDWQIRYGHPLFLLETFVDPKRFYGGVYHAANWLELGLTKGYRRTWGLSIMSAGKSSIAEIMAKLNRNTRLVLDYLRMTKNAVFLVTT